MVLVAACSVQHLFRVSVCSTSVICRPRFHPSPNSGLLHTELPASAGDTCPLERTSQTTTETKREVTSYTCTRKHTTPCVCVCVLTSAAEKNESSEVTVMASSSWMGWELPSVGRIRVASLAAHKQLGLGS